MKKNKITFILTELMLIVLAAFFIIRIFSDNESMKRVAVIVEDSVTVYSLLNKAEKVRMAERRGF